MNYTTHSFPKTRIATLDVGQMAKRKHTIAALLDLDVTVARRAIKNYRAATGEPLSFTAWLIKTISRTLEAHPHAYAYLKGKKALMVFDDIDISIVMEREFQGELVPLPYVIRQSNQKTFTDITREIQAAKQQPLTEDDVVVGQQRNTFSVNLYYVLPGFLRRAIWKFILAHPAIAQKQMGSVIVTSIGMMGKVNGWFIHTSVHPLSFGVSSIVKQPAVVQDEIVIREFLKITVLFDHDVIDGAPIARFIAKLAQNVEDASGLEAYQKEKGTNS
jgi:pyruvate/2-oxoglutarate dehydrogenase complex dihydrolipoamide acyltransferase (E2) component